MTTLEAEMGRLLEVRPALSPMGACILAALHMEIARDTRSFSRATEVAHAFVLREAATLEEASLLLAGPPDRNGRRFLRLTAGGAALFGFA